MQKENWKIVLRAGVLLGCVGLLAGCSVREATLSVGPSHERPKTGLKSAELNALLKTNYANAYEATSNKLATRFDLEYDGPGAIVSHEVFMHVSPTSIAEKKEISGNGLGGEAMTAFGPGVAVPVLGLLFQAASRTPHANPVVVGYEHLRQELQNGKIFWVARYVPDGHNVDNRIDNLAHRAILWAGDLEQAGWASGTSPKAGDAIYKIHKVSWQNWADANVDWAWEGYDGVAPVIPIVPARMDWIVQSWKNARKDPFYVVNPHKAAYPFMDLTSIEYRIQPGFSIPKWIQVHEADLTSGGWMVIYHQGDHAMVWKDGKTQAYPEPKDLVLKK
ncbi:hypothetical protein H7F10_04285 [Acidithiobacillus sp. HP-6]|uniref:hypothetical protein n=1 Tax=unclassified Acidithiobacillus TaxID=2614800 RepID=UPI001879E226|nr:MULTISPECIES: hypothetical protein [unclassified Acidithiobacillus]MBE7562188.1 hypothetical protein [Acidithiobacillus sp. HP-6]MBE7568913.1 hypothetical protein [Acidithiobacillus sp. HP-2]